MIAIAWPASASLRARLARAGGSRRGPGTTRGLDRRPVARRHGAARVPNTGGRTPSSTDRRDPTASTVARAVASVDANPALELTLADPGVATEAIGSVAHRGRVRQCVAVAQQAASPSTGS